MIVKVCGISDPENYCQLDRLNIDMIGLNYYEPSKRFVGHNFNTDALTHSCARVGVFVNAPIDFILECINKHKLDYVQLHGNESAEMCKTLSKRSKVIKVFSIDSGFDFNQTLIYDSCDFFLFDTKTKNYGGSGRRFDWTHIHNYKGITPFIIAGGISIEHAADIKKIEHKRFQGIDINSCFETKPAYKNIDLIESFLKLIK